jgi:hypothetical protein
VVHVRGFEEPQAVATQVNRRAVAGALVWAGEVPAGKVDPRAHLAAHEDAIRRLPDEPTHPATLVGLEMRHDHVCQFFRVDHLRYRAADVLVHPVRPRVHERRPITGNQELVDRDPVLRPKLADAENAGNDFVDAGHGRCSSRAVCKAGSRKSVSLRVPRVHRR